MLDVKKLQAIRDKVLGVTVDPSTYGDLNSVVYLQQILDAVKGTDPLNIRGNLAEHIYLQKIRNAKLGVADGQFGSMPNSVYLQQIVNAFNGVADGPFGSLPDSAYLDVLYAIAGTAVPWYLAGGVPAANCLAAYQPLGAASQAASYINLVNPGTNDIDPNQGYVNPTWGATTGWTGNGISTQMRLGFALPSANVSVICRFSNVTGFNDKYLFGTLTNPAWFPIHRSAQSLFFNIGGQYLTPTFVDTTQGVVAMCGPNAYFNKVASGTVVGADFSTLTDLICIFNAAIGNPGSYIPARIQAIAFYDGVLTADQVIAITDAVNLLPPVP